MYKSTGQKADGWGIISFTQKKKGNKQTADIQSVEESSNKK